MLNYGSGLTVPWIKVKESAAIALIKNWLEKCDYSAYVSISGGKDSLVVAELVTRIYADCPLVWVNQGYLAEWEDCIELINLWRSQGRNVVELCPVRDLWHLYQDYGIPLEGKMTSKIDKIINQKLMYDPLEEYQKMHNIKGYAWGIRTEESRNRAMYLKKHGELHQLKNGLWRCSPIGFWTVQDVWQFIDKYKLPYPAMYDSDRYTIRNGPPIGTTGINWGRLAQLKRDRFDIWQQIVTQFPQLQNHA